MAVATGRVIRFDEVKGYGFIAPNDGGEDVFVHANDLSDRGLGVRVGTQVEFRVIEGERGLKAYDVRVVEDQRHGAEVPSVAVHDIPVGSASLLVGPAPREREPSEDELFEVFPEPEFRQQITEILLRAAPQLTGTTILELRAHLMEFARKNGWVE